MKGIKRHPDIGDRVVIYAGATILGGRTRIGSHLSQVHWTVMKAVLFVEAVLGGSMLIQGLFMIEAIFCIYSVKSVELANALTYGGRSACQYPVDTYPKPLRILFTVIAPFALVMHVPAAQILGHPLFGWPAWIGYLTPVSGLLLFAMMYLIFRHAMRFYRSTGS